MQQLLSTFQCPPQDDVQRFLTDRAIRFEKEDKSRTYLIMSHERNLLGYFSLTFKEIVYPSEILPKSANKRLGAIPDVEIDDHVRIRAYLIGQLAKNKAVDNNPVNMEFLLKEIYGVISAARKLIGGRAVILECEPQERLVSCYEQNGFKRIPMEPNHNGDITMYTIIRD